MLSNGFERYRPGRRLLSVFFVLLLVCGAGDSAMAAGAHPLRAARRHRHATAGGLAPTRLVPITAAIALSNRSGASTVALPAPGTGASVRAAFVQVQLSGAGSVSLGAPGAATATISNSSVSASAVGSGLAATRSGRLPVRISGHLRAIHAYVVAELVSTAHGDSLHQAIGDAAATRLGLRIGPGRTRAVSLPADAPRGSRAVLATLTGSLPVRGLLLAGAVPVMGGGTGQALTALLPVGGGHIRLRDSGAGPARLAIQLLAYVAPDRASSVGAPIELLAQPAGALARGRTTVVVAGRHGLPTADADAPPTGALVSIHVTPGPGRAWVAPVPLSTNDGRILDAAQAAPYASAGPGRSASAVVLAPLSPTGTLSLRGDSARVHVELLGASVGDIRIPAGTVVLGAADLRGLRSVSPDELIFQGAPAALASLRKGDILASGISRATPMGLLRKVTAVSHRSGDLVLATVPASIRDVLTQGTIQVQTTLTPSQVTSFRPASRGVRRLRPRAGATSPLGVEFNTSLAPSSWSSGLYADADGSLNISPSLDFTASASLFPPSFSAKFTAGAQESFSAELQAALGSQNLDVSKQLDSYLFSPYYVQVGLVPILIWPQAVIDLNASGGVQGVLDATINQSRSFSFGAGFSTSNGFSAFANVSPNQVSHSLRLSGNAGLMLSATAGMNLLIDGVGGPGLSAGPYVGWSADTTQNPWWKLSAGIEASLNFSVRAINISYSHTFATWAQVLATAGGPFETVTISPHTATVRRGQTLQLGSSTTGAVPGLDWSTDGGTVSASGLYTAPETAGTYHVTATSQDEPAAYDTATITVPPVPPSVPTNVSAVPAPSGATVSWSAPSDDGGAPISSYSVTATSSQGATETQLFVSSTSYTFNDLTPGQAYTFTVTATNSAGLTGPTSAPSQSVAAGNAAYAIAEPDSLTFPNTSNGRTSPPQTVTVLAPSSQSMTLSTITLSGDSPSEFQIENDQCSNRTVAANGSCTFQVEYAPTACCAADATAQIPYSGDGGAPLTVALAYQENYPGTLNGVTMPDDLHAWAFGAAVQNGSNGNASPGTVLSTGDGGQTWKSEDLSSTLGSPPDSESLAGASFLDSQHGWAVVNHCHFYRCGDTSIILTTDGGQSWTNGGALPSGMGNVNGVKFLDTMHGFVIGSGVVNNAVTPMLAVTTDGGQTWNLASTPSPAGAASFDAISFASDGLHGVISGTGYDAANQDNENYALYTSDGGQTWRLASIAGDSYTPSFQSPTSGDDGAHWWAVAATNLFESSDGGATWTAQNTPALTNGTSAVFTDAEHGWVVDAPQGSNGNPPTTPESVWYTSDGGTTWTDTVVAPVNQNCPGPGGPTWVTYPIMPYIAAADATHAVLAGGMYTLNSNGTQGQGEAAVETSTNGDQSWSTPPCW